MGSNLNIEQKDKTKKKGGNMCCALNEKVKKLTVADVSLVKFSVFFATIIIVKLFPTLLNISYPVLILLVIVCAAKPLYNIWILKMG